MTSYSLAYDNGAYAVNDASIVWHTPSSSGTQAAFARYSRHVGPSFASLGEEWVSVISGLDFGLVRTLLLEAANTITVSFLRGYSTAAVTEVAPRGSPAAVLKLVEQWLAEDNDYDETVWPIIQQDIEANRMSERSRFHD